MLLYLLPYGRFPYGRFNKRNVCAQIKRVLGLIETKRKIRRIKQL